MVPRAARSGSDLPQRADDPDAGLVTGAKAGDRAPFEELVRRHADHVYAVARQLGLSRDAAEEVTQEAFLRAWRGIEGFKEEALFSTWLYRIAVNEAKRRLRRETRRALLTSLDDADALEPPDLRSEPQRRAAHSELRRAVARSVHALPLKYRAPLILRDIEGLSTSDAAAVLGLSQAAFKSRLHRARLAVRDALGDQLDGGP